MKQYILPALFLMLALLWGCERGKAGDPTTTGDTSKAKVTFVELGSVNCIPCKAMQPVMKAIEEKYGGQVKVVFYDVWKDPAPGEKYRVQLIPTQVFLDQKGKEIARHVGLFPKEEILELLKKHGIQ